VGSSVSVGEVTVVRNRLPKVPGGKKGEGLLGPLTVKLSFHDLRVNKPKSHAPFQFKQTVFQLKEVMPEKRLIQNPGWHLKNL
jgi:hypothetical protein